MKRTPMTLRGAEALRSELKRLKGEARPMIIRQIADARGHGDLSENAEYHAAREQQGFIEGRIKEIEGKLANAQIIDPGKLPDTGKVVFGERETVRAVKSKEVRLVIVAGNCPAGLKEGLKKAAEFSGIPTYEYATSRSIRA